MKRGAFIVFEGIDGSGKTTQAIKFANYLFSKNNYSHVLLTREPYKEREIRKILHSEKNPYTKVKILTKLFIEDRKEHLRNIIYPALKKGIDVVCDRYSLSTMAYQQAQGIPLNKLLRMHKKMIIPDIVFFVDVSTRVAMERMKKDSRRKKEQKFEKEAKFIEEVRKNYLSLASLEKHRIFLINGERNQEDIFKEIVSIYEQVIRKFSNLTLKNNKK